MNEETREYPLGHSDPEIERLIDQSRFLGELTEDALGKAELRPGGDVLDLGCGPGDVSLLASRLVGARGSVLGIDGSARAVEAARERARNAGLSNVRFAVADVEDYVPEEPVDALIGRLILMYLRDPVGAVRRLAKSVRRGGLVLFQEMEMSMVRSVPESPLFHKCANAIIGAIRGAGLDFDTGTRLHSIFQEAGLALPDLKLAARVEGKADSYVFTYLAETVRTMLPVMERFGVATADEMDVDTLAGRLRDEALERNAVLIPPPLVTAWVRLGASP